MTTPKEALERIAVRSIAQDDDDEKELRRQLYHIEALAKSALASLKGEDAVEKVKALAHRFWSIHPSTIAAMNLTREEFYVREMMALLATGLVPDEAAIRADERERCAKLIKPKRPRPCDCDHCDCHNQGDNEAVAAWDADTAAAAAIRSGGAQ